MPLPPEGFTECVRLNRANRNSVIQVSFKLDGASFFHLSYNKEKAHLFRVMVLPTGISIMKDPVLVEPKQPSVVLAKSDTKFESGKWYTMLVEVQGDLQHMHEIHRGSKGIWVFGILVPSRRGHLFISRC